MTTERVNLFVYGTLMPGFRNYMAIQDHVHSVHAATTRGILVDLGSFPAMVHGDGIVRGVMLVLDADAFRITDAIEGFRHDREQSLYIREAVEITLNDGTTAMAWTYFFAEAENIADRPRPIATHIENTPVYEWHDRRDPKQAGENAE